MRAAAPAAKTEGIGMELGATSALAAFAAETDRAEIPANAYRQAQVAFADWLAVTICAYDEPVVQVLATTTKELGEASQASLIGRPEKRSVAHAALVNGTAGHALDYDDSLVPFGHPSAVLFPGLVALAEWLPRSGRDLLTAYLVGLEIGVALGRWMGWQHYEAGWHSTSTLGHLAAAAAACRLVGLGRDETANALGIAGTQACGLRRVFGTMGKPLHAGRAAEVGVMAALLARNGFQCAGDIVEGRHGLLEVMHGSFDEGVLADLGGGDWAVSQIAQKYHASCHGTHSAVEAVRDILGEHELRADDIAGIQVTVSPLSLTAAYVTAPRTGLEGKFSISYCVANAALGRDTGVQAFSEERVGDPGVRALSELVNVSSSETMSTFGAEVCVRTHDGRELHRLRDVMDEVPGLGEKEKRVRSKFEACVAPVLGNQQSEETLSMIERLVALDDVSPILRLTQGRVV